ncbi:hypothetical protein T484DRAFT_1803823, partial [Baffinella frigidus]
VSCDVRDEYGNTLLIIAAQNGNKRIAKICLRRGALINAQNFRGQTALHYCFAFGYADLGLYLESKAADPRIRNEYGLDAREGLEPEETLVNTNSDSPPLGFSANARSVSEDLSKSGVPALARNTSWWGQTASGGGRGDVEGGGGRGLGLGRAGGAPMEVRRLVSDYNDDAMSQGSPVILPAFEIAKVGTPVRVTARLGSLDASGHVDLSRSFPGALPGAAGGG